MTCIKTLGHLDNGHKDLGHFDNVDKIFRPFWITQIKVFDHFQVIWITWIKVLSNLDNVDNSFR